MLPASKRGLYPARNDANNRDHRAYTVAGAQSPRGRLRDETTNDDGSVTVLAVSGLSVLVRIVNDSDSRRTFRRACRANGVHIDPNFAQCIIAPEHTYSHATGKVRDGHAEVPDTFRIVGDGAGIAAVVAGAAVAGWEPCVAVRVPVTSSGMGPEKVRPPMGSVFGKPAQVEVTAAALAKGRSDRDIAARRAGEL